MLLIPLVVLYLLELRMRRNWLLRRHREAAEAEAEVQRRLRLQRHEERYAAQRRGTDNGGGGAAVVAAVPGRPTGMLAAARAGPSAAAP